MGLIIFVGGFYYLFAALIMIALVVAIVALPFWVTYLIGSFLLSHAKARWNRR